MLELLKSAAASALVGCNRCQPVKRGASAGGLPLILSYWITATLGQEKQHVYVIGSEYSGSGLIMRVARRAFYRPGDGQACLAVTSKLVENRERAGHDKQLIEDGWQ
jgi:hypothetical protein